MSSISRWNTDIIIDRAVYHAEIFDDLQDWAESQSSYRKAPSNTSGSRITNQPQGFLRFRTQMGIGPLQYVVMSYGASIGLIALLASSNLRSLGTVSQVFASEHASAGMVPSLSLRIVMPLV